MAEYVSSTSEFCDYHRKLAVSYAVKWALNRNPLFYSFTGIGGDCTNFVSQCLYAGCCAMNCSGDPAWYYRSADDRAPAWTSVEAFYDFLLHNDGAGPFAIETDANAMRPGDVIQLGHADGDFYHTLLLAKIFRGNFLVCAHSDDALYRNLDTYQYSKIRYLHILGARNSSTACFPSLYRGIRNSNNC